MAAGAQQLVSVSEAARRLGVAKSQVHNLAAQGQLDKVAPEPGRAHHPAGAAVITLASLEELARRRGAVVALPEATHESLTKTDLAGPGLDARTATSPAEPSVVDAALELKAGLHQALELRGQHYQSDVERLAKRFERLADDLLDLAKDVRELGAYAKETDQLTGSFGEATTQLLVPTDVSGIDGT